MGKTSKPRRKPSANSDPVLDRLAVLDAKNMLIGNMISLGWRMALMVLVPIFIGVQLDKRFDSAPSITLAAFFIAVFGACMLIYNTYKELNSQQAETGKAKQTKKIKRINNA